MAIKPKPMHGPSGVMGVGAGVIAVAAKGGNAGVAARSFL